MTNTSIPSQSQPHEGELEADSDSTSLGSNGDGMGISSVDSSIWTQQTAMMQYLMSFKFRPILVNVTRVVYSICSHLSFIDVFPKRISKSVNLILGPYRGVPQAPFHPLLQV